MLSNEIDTHDNICLFHICWLVGNQYATGWHTYVANGIDKCFSCNFICQMSQFYLITFIKQHATCTQKLGTTSSKGC